MRASIWLITLEVCLLVAPFAALRSVVAAATQSREERLATDIAALESPDPSARALAACRIAAQGRRAEIAVPALLKLLGDATAITPIDCWSDRSSPGLEAARALGSIRSTSAIDPLLEALRNPNPYIRRTAARALGLMMRGRR